MSRIAHYLHSGRPISRTGQRLGLLSGVIISLGLAGVAWPAWLLHHLALGASASLTALLYGRLWRAQPDHPLRLVWLLVVLGTSINLGVIGLDTLVDLALLPQTVLNHTLLLGGILCYSVSLAVRIRRLTTGRFSLAAALDAATIVLAASALELWLLTPLNLATIPVLLPFVIIPLLSLGQLLIISYLLYNSPASQQRGLVWLLACGVIGTITAWLSALRFLDLLPIPVEIIELVGTLSYSAFAWSAHAEWRGLTVTSAKATGRAQSRPLTIVPYLLLALVFAATIPQRILIGTSGLTAILLEAIIGLGVVLVLARQWLILRENLRLLSQLQSSQAIIAMARDEAAREARTDSLTGLPNQRFLREYLAPTLAYHRRGELPLGVAFIDIDHFKRVNDRFGHGAGDAALIQVGQRLRQTLRDGDIVARYGGEEFVLLLPNTGGDEAPAIVERLRQSLHYSPVPLPDTQMVALTVSIGVAIFPQHGDTADTLLLAADQALYEAKAAGRDCVRVAAINQSSRPCLSGPLPALGAAPERQQ